MPKARSVLPALVLIALLPAACTDSVSTENFGPAGILWELQAFELTGGSVIGVAEPDRYTLLFDHGGSLAARAGCNRCSGRYTFAGDLFRMELSGCTRVACPPGSLYDRYVEALNAVTAFSMSGNELRLTYAQGVMRFSSE
jgi:heat shock protein HslJ